MRRDAPQIAEIQLEAIEELLERTEQRLEPEDHRMVKEVVESLLHLMKMVRAHGTTIARLRRLVGMASSEKTADVLGSRAGEPGPSEPHNADPAGPDQATGEAPATSAAAAPPDASGQGATPAAAAAGQAPKKKRKGHGRVAEAAYPDAEHRTVSHDRFLVGEPCPSCLRGKLYRLKVPARFLRIVGQAPLAALCWDCDRLRCGACGDIFTAPAPQEALGPKYDETAAAMMALMRYRVGVPLNRLDHLQRDLETPVPKSTQWEVVNQRVADVEPVYSELLRLGAQGSILHNDDTYNRILEFMGKRRAKLLNAGKLEDPERTGLFTTAIVSITVSGPIAIFFTGRHHAGENLAEMLAARAKGAARPLLMSDALERNLPKNHVVDWANCLCHGRRNVVDEVANYPDECKHILEELGKVFEVEANCRKHGLGDDERLRVHQRDSGPVMDGLHEWLNALVAEKRIEPNSGMGQAIDYLLDRWDRFTRFLHVPGAPLENNICERALKKAIRHRNNSLFYRTQHGADVSDIYTTLIHTAELHHVNAFQYLTALMRNAKAVAADPASWLPWNYREALTAIVIMEIPAPRTHVPLESEPHQRPPPN